MTALFSSLDAWVTQNISVAESGASALAVLVVAGLLASLLPCVYPLYPITAAVVRSRGEGPAHPLMYYGGLVGAYGGLGLAAGMFGGAFNQVLRYGLTQIVLGAVLLLLAAATAGLIHVSIFSPRAQTPREGWTGTLLMGAGAGLLSSACVGPVVASILVGLATSTESLSASAVALACLQMGAFGAGVGLPFLGIGLLGLRMPKSGVWMVWVQRALALLLVVFAYGYFEKGLEIWGFDSDEIALIIGGSAGLFACVYVFEGPDRPVPLRLRRSGAAVGAALTAAVLFRALGPTPVARGVAVDGSFSPGRETIEDAGLTWYVDEDAAYAAARREGKNVFIDFYGSWCTNCKAFKSMTRTDQALRAALENAVLLEIRDTSPAFLEYRDDPRFPELKVGLPFFIITSPNRDLLYKTNDYRKTEEMALFLEG